MSTATTEDKLRRKLYVNFEEAINTLRERLHQDDYYNMSPSWIAIFCNKQGEMEVRAHQGSGGFMDFLHGEVIELARMDTSNFKREIDDLIAEGLDSEERQRWFDDDESLVSILGEEEYNTRTERVKDDAIDNNFTEYQEGCIEAAYSFITNKEPGVWN